MATNNPRNGGVSKEYQYDRGGQPAQFGPFIGIVTDNSDATRSGRLKVYINEFNQTTKTGTPKLDDPTLWTSVNYCPPFYGVTPATTEQPGATTGPGGYAPGNRQSYGMWFVPPDIGVEVLCVFAGGDRSQGYWIGCVPVPGLNRMIPAMGAVKDYAVTNNTQNAVFSTRVKQLPVVEINEYNKAINESPKFFDAPKPVQSVQAAIFWQQGLDRDNIRGPISSSSQRETPSAVFGISTPGSAIYQGGLDPKTVRGQIERGEIRPQDAVVIGRKGGHTFVMDDGDLDGKDTLIRIRTAKGHQITMSDDGDCFYITNANGQTWIELNKEGAVDIFSTNSVNIRTQGTLNFHADKDINMYAGGQIKVKSVKNTWFESDDTFVINGLNKILMYSKTEIGVRSDGKLALKSNTGSWSGGTSLNFRGDVINLNSGSTLPVATVANLTNYKLPDTQFQANVGWVSTPGTLETIVTRAPTHEPYPYHNTGVNVTTKLDAPATANVSGIAGGTARGTDTGLVATETSSKSVTAFLDADQRSVDKPVTAEVFASETPSTVSIGQ